MQMIMILFKHSHNQKIIIKSIKFYYPRHTPPDLLFEKHHKYTNNVYTWDDIYE